MDYDSFAPFYDDVMGDRSDVIRILRTQITRHHPTATSILELGCGTGTVLAGFKGKYTLAGIELSPQMLKIAQRKLPKAHLVTDTIAGFELDQTFDVIYCVFDTINHLTTFSDWQKLFKSAQKHLSANGLFIFDMDTIRRLQAVAATSTFEQRFNGNTMLMDVIGLKENEVEFHVTIQEPHPDGAIQVYEEHVREVSFPVAQVTQELEKHFIILDAFASHRQTLSRADRVYFICRKP